MSSPGSPYLTFEGPLRRIELVGGIFRDQHTISRGIGRKKVRTKAPPIYQLKVTLCDFERPIWRRMLVAGDTALGDLHWILQLSMGWTHSQLHRFETDDA